MMIKLTEREDEILSMLYTDKSQKQMGGELGIKINTLKRHCANIYTKVGVEDRVHLMAIEIASLFSRSL